MPDFIAYTEANLGKKCPIYGGTLTDPMTLPEGTTFDVANGCWKGQIVVINGEKKIKNAHGYIAMPDDVDGRILSLYNIKPPKTAEEKANARKTDGSIIQNTHVDASCKAKLIYLQHLTPGNAAVIVGFRLDKPIDGVASILSAAFVDSDTGAEIFAVCRGDMRKPSFNSNAIPGDVTFRDVNGTYVPDLKFESDEVEILNGLRFTFGITAGENQDVTDGMLTDSFSNLVSHVWHARAK